jgi:hypothetical protein
MVKAAESRHFDHRAMLNNLTLELGTPFGAQDGGAIGDSGESTQPNVLFNMMGVQE